jgi:hypothetical protein
MAFVQSTYSENIGKALPGMPAFEFWKADSRTCETAAGIGFGLAVGKGTADKGAILGAAAASGFLGISVRDKAVINSTADKYAQYGDMSVMYEGDIWVTVGADVNDGDDVSFVASTGVLSSAAASGTQFVIAGARWMTTAASGALARLRLGGALPAA